MAIQIKCVDTSIVIPVSTRKDNGKLEDIYYRVDIISDFPELAISLSLGTQATVTPEENKTGFKSKGIKSVIYQPLLTFRFNRQMQPSIDRTELINQTPSANGSTVFIYTEDSKREEKDYANHMALINDYVLPVAEKALLSPKYQSARFSSWLYTGLLLIDLVNWDVQESGNTFTQTLKPITQEQLVEVVTSSHSQLLKANAYVSQSHALIAEKLKQKVIPASEVTK